MHALPKTWTHHHTQRLYHLSMLACFLFIVGVIIYGIFAVLLEANAEQQTQSISISATVPGLEPEPAVIQQPPSGGGTALPYNQPQSSQGGLKIPVVSIHPPNYIPFQNFNLPKVGETSLPVYNTQNPTFEGTTSIPSALIFSEINSYGVIRGGSYADGLGNWSWTSTEPVSPGFHTVYVTAQDPDHLEVVATARLDFYISVPAEVPPTQPPPENLLTPNAGSSFNVFVKIPQPFKIIAPGADLVAEVKIINLGSAKNPVRVVAQYLIEDGKGQIFTQSSENLAVQGHLSLLKLFHSNPYLPEGQYSLTVRVFSKDTVATSADTFDVNAAAALTVGQAPKVDFTIFFQSLLALLLLFTLLAYYEFHRIFIISGRIKKQKDLVAFW